MTTDEFTPDFAFLLGCCYASGWWVCRDPIYVFTAVMGTFLAWIPPFNHEMAYMFALWTWGLPFLVGTLVAPHAIAYLGTARSCRIVLAFLRLISLSRDVRFMVQIWEAEANSWLGRTTEACALASGIQEALPRSPWLTLSLVGGLSDLYVNAGRYRETVDLVDRFSSPLVPLTGGWHVLVRLNQLEALINLGRVDEAGARFKELQAHPKLPTFVRNWMLLHGAWVKTRTGQYEAALHDLDLSRFSSWAYFVPMYLSEVCYCRAMAFIGLSKWAEARDAIALGLSKAMRASSRRNAKFLMGVCAYRQGSLEEAVNWFREGAEDPYRGQGGEELTCYGDALARLGRIDEARDAYRLVLERDPESAAVDTARARIAALPGVTGMDTSSHGEACQAPV